MTIRTTWGDGCTTLPHGWRVPNHLRLLRAPYTRAWHDHRTLDSRKKVLVAVQGPWRLSARADRKKHTEAYLDYTYTVILVTDGEVVRGR